MDELEKIEQDIVRLYDVYVVNSRCLFFLEQKLEEFEETERMKIEVNYFFKNIRNLFEYLILIKFLYTSKGTK